MPDPAAPFDPRIAQMPLAGERVGLLRAAQVLREVAGYDRGVDPRRGAVTAAQAGLLEVCAARWGELPADVAKSARAVAAAVDRATGRRPDHD